MGPEAEERGCKALQVILRAGSGACIEKWECKGEDSMKLLLEESSKGRTLSLKVLKFTVEVGGHEYREKALLLCDFLLLWC